MKMGKKKKKYIDEWDVSADEQRAAADDMYRLQDGKMDISDFTKSEEASNKAVGLGQDLENLIARDFITVDEPETPIRVATKEEMEACKTVTETVKELTEPLSVQKAEVNLRGIKVNFDPLVGRLCINDHISPTTMALQYISFTNIIDESFDPSDLADEIVLLYTYVLSCKHPYAVITQAEFESVFKKYESFDTNKFIIIMIDHYFMLYYIDSENKNNLIDIPDYYKFSDKQLLQFFVTLALRAGETHNICYTDNVEYMTQYKSYLDERYPNALDYYVNMIDNDEQTVIKNGSSDTFELTIEAIDDDLLKMKARQSITYLTGENDEDDDDESDTPDYWDDDKSEESKPEEMIQDFGEDEDPIISIEPEESPAEVKVKSNDDDSMVIPVIHKNTES